MVPGRRPEENMASRANVGSCWLRADRRYRSNYRREQLMDKNETRLIPVKDWNQYHVWPPVGGLRHLIFHAKRNGFHAVIRRVGRRVLINEREFFRWVEYNDEAGYGNQG